LTALTAGWGEAIRFELGPVEMQFRLAVSKEGGGQAGVRIG
jgi:hypothetical protein